MIEKGRQFLREKVKWHHEFVAPGDTNLSDATDNDFEQVVHTLYHKSSSSSIC